MWSSNLQERNFINEICPWIVVESVCLGVGKKYWVSYSASLLMPLRQIAYWIRIDLFDSPLSFNHLAPKIYFNCHVCVCVCVCVFALQSYPTLCNLMNWKRTGCSAHGIHLAREFWSMLPVPSAGDLSNPGIESRSPTSQADSLVSEPPRNHIILFLQEAKIGAVLYALLKTPKPAGKWTMYNIGKGLVIIFKVHRQKWRKIYEWLPSPGFLPGEHLQVAVKVDLQCFHHDYKNKW